MTLGGGDGQQLHKLHNSSSKTLASRGLFVVWFIQQKHFVENMQKL